MIREIYTRDANDPLYDENKIENNGLLEVLLSKLRMILGTNKGEVLGEYPLGIDIESLVFKTRKNAKEIENEIHNQLGMYVGGYTGYNIKPEVKFGHHKDGYDYAIIDIKVNDVKIQSYLID